MNQSTIKLTLLLNTLLEHTFSKHLVNTMKSFNFPQKNTIIVQGKDEPNASMGDNNTIYVQSNGSIWNKVTGYWNKIFNGGIPTFTTGTTLPSNELGNDNDLFLTETTGEVSKKVEGEWISVYKPPLDTCTVVGLTATISETKYLLHFTFTKQCNVVHLNVKGIQTDMDFQSVYNISFAAGSVPKPYRPTSLRTISPIILRDTVTNHTVHELQLVIVPDGSMILTMIKGGSIPDSPTYNLMDINSSYLIHQPVSALM